MLLGIDHLVIAVDDPDAAAAELEVELGLAATGGGRHDTGTRNRILFLGDAYLELIGVWDRALALAHPIGAAVVRALDAGTPGLVTYAIATDGARREVTALRRTGSAISDVIAGSRLRPDGEAVAWHCAFPPLLGPAEPPFLIEHELSGAEWDEDARRARVSFVQPFGGTARLVGIELVVPDPKAAAVAYASTVGIVVPPGPGAVPGDREVHIGEHSVRLVPPGGGPAGDAAASEPLAPEPLARVGISATAGDRLLRDLFGVRFARL
ncbi:MAG: VOC family protein [Candidatus Limnocylindria bacterium]